MANHSDLSVLIVDDNPRLIEDYKLFLTEKNVQVFTATTGSEGIEAAIKHKPSVILLDLMLPHLNGIETLHALKNDDKTKDIPVIIITALVEDKEKEASLQAGAVAYLAKVDTEPDELLDAIKHAAEKS